MMISGKICMGDYYDNSLPYGGYGIGLWEEDGVGGAWCVVI